VQDTFKDWSVDPSVAHDSDHFAIGFVIDHGRKKISNSLGLKYSLKDTQPSDWVKA
jgi:hypothetical protein